MGDPSNTDIWPRLPKLEAWQDTLTTVHMWTQIVGKVRLELGPWINHSWGSALYVTTTGLTTSPMPTGGRSLEIDFDFADHALRFQTSDGQSHAFALEPMSVASFYDKVTAGLGEVGVDVSIWPRPVEVESTTPFPDDTANDSYDADAMHDYWRALVQVDRVFKRFRAGFLGKVSPVHFFWGAFDLAVTRFSGEPAPLHPGGVPNCADWVMQEAYSRQLSSAGFWPGTGLGEPAFYSYAYPQPDGFDQASVKPDSALFNSDLGEFVLPYDAVRKADDPDGTLLAFLETTYDAAADLAGWDRKSLEGLAPPQRR